MSHRVSEGFLGKIYEEMEEAFSWAL